MDPDQMKKRCPDAEFLHLDYLRNKEIVFHKSGTDGTGKADVVVAHGSVVYGAVYKLSKDDVESLDEYEGVSSNHYKKKKVKTAAGYKCLIYLACDTKIKEELLPSPAYKSRIVRGLVSIDAPKEYIRKLRSTPTMKPVPFTFVLPSTLQLSYIKK